MKEYGDYINETKNAAGKDKTSVFHRGLLLLGSQSIVIMIGAVMDASDKRLYKLTDLITTVNKNSSDARVGSDGWAHKKRIYFSYQNNNENVSMV